MAHWFHRNPFKATGPVSFDLKGIASDRTSQKICSDTRTARTYLLDVITDPNQDVATMDSASNGYLSLLHGFISTVDGSEGESKLRYAIKFKWTNSLLGNSVLVQQDSVYELCCMMINVALWYTKHASTIAGKDDISMEEAKDIHKCLKKAAGIFQQVKNEKGMLLEKKFDSGVDLDDRVLSAYVQQSTAEAQEVTVARAIELKHAPSLISALANETAKLFQSALISLQSIDHTFFQKWKKYLEVKYFIYLAYAYTYMGESLLAQDIGGKAVRSLKEAHTSFEKAETLCKEYSAAKGPGHSAKPEKHLFFRKLGPLVTRVLEKAERENGFIYHEKVPELAPELELKATYGLVKPEEFSLPSMHALWTADVYNSFDLSQAMMTDMKKSLGEKEHDEKLPDVKEKEGNVSGSDPKNSSGCSLS